MKLCHTLNQSPRHEDVWGSGVILHAFLTTALDGGDSSASYPSRSAPGERDPGTHRSGVWVGPRVGLDAVMKRRVWHIDILNLSEMFYSEIEI
jgi:hypothetical protein